MAPVELFDLFFGDEILDHIATKSNEYTMMKFGNLSSITADNIRTFFWHSHSLGLVQSDELQAVLVELRGYGEQDCQVRYVEGQVPDGEALLPLG
jgi:hypothetical protein